MVSIFSWYFSYELDVEDSTWFYQSCCYKLESAGISGWIISRPHRLIWSRNHQLFQVTYNRFSSHENGGTVNPRRRWGLFLLSRVYTLDSVKKTSRSSPRRAHNPDRSHIMNKNNRSRLHSWAQLRFFIIGGLGKKLKTSPVSGVSTQARMHLLPLVPLPLSVGITKHWTETIPLEI